MSLSKERVTITKNTILTSKSVLLVEGMDEVYLFDVLIKRMQLEREIQTFSVHGISKYPHVFSAFLKLPGIRNVKSYGLICDADNDAQSALMRLQKLLQDKKQPCPNSHAAWAHDGNKDLKVGIFIMPGNGATTGMVEDLCLRSVDDHPNIPHVDEYLLRIKQEPHSPAPKNESKAKVQAFLAGMYESTPQLGLAAQKGYWNLNHEAFIEIYNFIRELTTF